MESSKKPSWMSSKITLSISQTNQSQDATLELGLLEKITHTSKYVVLQQVNIEFIPTIKSGCYGTVTVSLLDTRPLSLPEKRRVAVIIPSDIYCNINISGVDDILRTSASPWKIQVSCELEGLEHGTQVGVLRMVPYYRYTNNMPSLRPPMATLNCTLGNYMLVNDKTIGKEDENFSLTQVYVVLPKETTIASASKMKGSKESLINSARS